MEHAVSRGGRKGVAVRRYQGITEGEIHLDRARRCIFEGPGGSVERGGNSLLRVVTGRDVDGESDVIAEKVQLDGGLVRPGPVKFFRPVCGDDDHRDS
ncbi:hypothetical protein D3C73_1303680 [compost metagenome]